MSKSSTQVDPKIAELYHKLIDSVPEVESKGKNLLYTSMNGNMYTLVGKDGKVGIRLGKEDFAKFLEQYNTVQLKQYGYNMREYVEVPMSLLQKTKELSLWLQKSHEYAKTLKPKPTNPKKSK